jgi:hypothetical protein
MSRSDWQLSSADIDDAFIAPLESLAGATGPSLPPAELRGLPRGGLSSDATAVGGDGARTGCRDVRAPPRTIWCCSAIRLASAIGVVRIGDSDNACRLAGDTTARLTNAMLLGGDGDCIRCCH